MIVFLRNGCCTEQGMGDYFCNVNVFTERLDCFDTELNRAPAEFTAQQNQLYHEEEERNPGWLLSFVPKEVQLIIRESELGVGLKAGQAAPVIRSAARSPLSMAVVAGGIALVAGAVHLFGQPSHPGVAQEPGAAPPPGLLPVPPAREDSPTPEENESLQDTVVLSTKPAEKPGPAKTFESTQAAEATEQAPTNENAEEESTEAAEAVAKNGHARDAELSAALTPEQRQAVDEAVKKNLGFVTHLLANEFSNRARIKNVPMEDLIAVGRTALWRAALRHDSKHDSGAKLITYAQDFIRQAAREVLAQHDRQGFNEVSTLPRRIRRAELALEKEASAANQPRTKFSDEEIAAKLKMTVQEMNDELAALRASQNPTLLSMPRGMRTGPHNDTVGDALPDQATADPESKLTLDTLVQHLEAAIATLTPNEQRIIRERRLAEPDAAKTLVELGRDLGGVSREYVRQLETRALAKLRTFFKEHGLADAFKT